MSVWGDILDRGCGAASRKEDNNICDWTYGEIGKTMKFPTQLNVPEDIRAIYISFVLLTHNGSEPIHLEHLLWAYKLRKKNFQDFESIVNGLEEEFKGFTYYPDEVGPKRVSEESKKMIEELRKRLKKHNEKICGKKLPPGFA